jgi:hypothetical protein
VLVALGLVVACRLEAPLKGRRGRAVLALAAALAGLYVLALLVPFARDFFALTLPDAAGLLAATAGTAVGAVALVLAPRLLSRWWPSAPGRDPRPRPAVRTR